MPCSDQTEILELVINAQEEVKHYRLYKMSCGGGIGQTELLPYLKDRRLADILANGLEDFVFELEEMADLEQFLFYKQFFSIRAALSVWTGQSNGGKEQPFVLDECVYTNGETHLKGWIEIQLIREEIKACANCGSCKTSSNPKAKKAIEKKRVRQSEEAERMQDILRSVIENHA